MNLQIWVTRVHCSDTKPEEAEVAVKEIDDSREAVSRRGKQMCSSVQDGYIEAMQTLLRGSNRRYLFLAGHSEAKTRDASLNASGREVLLPMFALPSKPPVSLFI